MNIATVMRPYKVARVRFHSGLESEAMSKLYEYRTRLDVKPGMSAVVEANGILKVVDIMEVVEPHEATFQGELKWLVDTIDYTEYLDRLKRESEINQRLAQLSKEAENRKAIKRIKDAFEGELDLQQELDRLVAELRNL